MRQGSYTDHVLDMFRRHRFSWYVDRELRTIGGDITPEDLDSCFALMEQWLHLVIFEVRAGFPQSWDITIPMQVLDMTDGHAPRMDGERFLDEDNVTHLQRLALWVQMDLAAPKHRVLRTPAF